MQTFTTIGPLRNFLSDSRARGQRVALVPTMGALHEGHLRLVRRAKELCGAVVVSIFVNPAQFNNKSDLERYPRNLERDSALLQQEKITAVFAPGEREIFGDGFDSWVNVAGISELLEGLHRPGHFQGVATVVSILFNLIRPDVALFGEKDFQQLRLIERMTNDLKFGIEIEAVPTARDEDGLALSSRNARLSPVERSSALALNRGLTAAANAFAAGTTKSEVLIRIVEQELEKHPLVKTEYMEVVDGRSLKSLAQARSGARLCIAAHVGSVRLIDNVEL